MQLNEYCHTKKVYILSKSVANKLGVRGKVLFLENYIFTKYFVEYHSLDHDKHVFWRVNWERIFSTVIISTSVNSWESNIKLIAEINLIFLNRIAQLIENFSLTAFSKNHIGKWRVEWKKKVWAWERKTQ